VSASTEQLIINTTLCAIIAFNGLVTVKHQLSTVAEAFVAGIFGQINSIMWVSRFTPPVSIRKFL
jgi:hypothetical protein